MPRATGHTLKLALLQKIGQLGMVLRRTLVALLALTVAASKRIDAPCSACRAIAQELQERLDNEPVRNHLDMRHRLDAQGNRQGRVIDYRMSELRAVELLDNLCTRMKQWTLVKINTTNDAGEVGGRSWCRHKVQRDPRLSTCWLQRHSRTACTWLHGWLQVTGRKRRWDKVSGASADSRPDKDEETALQKRLEGYCGRVLEDHDESIADALRQGTLEAAGGVNRGAVKAVRPVVNMQPGTALSYCST
ncbi:uncharacterized protein LOC107419784 [Haematococcus lacustris]|uniref:Uncharacterized protein LOC107419784 n=1 Tax=Haematococcus lacustris TaxID=44745 RepID=A0A699ZUT9_HAELA|nr:uncharacterized protein LOC107419784 [Haematococcus lacustris]